MYTDSRNGRSSERAHLTQTASRTNLVNSVLKLLKIAGKLESGQVCVLWTNNPAWEGSSINVLAKASMATSIPRGPRSKHFKINVSQSSCHFGTKYCMTIVTPESIKSLAQRMDGKKADSVQSKYTAPNNSSHSLLYYSNDINRRPDGMLARTI